MLQTGRADTFGQVQTFVKVWLPGNPEYFYVDTIEGAKDTLQFTIEEEESEGVCFAPIHMTQEEFDDLPEFTGF